MTPSPADARKAVGGRKRDASIAVNPPRPRMPPLNALKAFEAAGRHESFAKAATELGVTPAAVSQQVKALEDWLGSSLFVRHAQGLRLTEAGKSAIPAFSKAFDAMGLAVQQLRAASPRNQISIAALPSVAQLWLGPKLPALRQAFPKLRASIHALERPPDFTREPFDLALFFMREGASECRSFVLSVDHIFPVCTPETAVTLKSFMDLAAHPLLWDTSWDDDWPRWLKAAGAPGLPVEAGSAFSLYSLAVQATLDGAGILMGHEALLAPQLSSGALVAPFDLPLSTGFELKLLVPEWSSSLVTAIAEWLTSSDLRRHEGASPHAAPAKAAV